MTEQTRKFVYDKTNEKAQDNTGALISWAHERGLTQEELARLVFRMLTIIGHQQLEYTAPGSEFGATVQGPDFGMQIRVIRISDEDLRNHVKSTTDGQEH
mgnify:CR=1 FL=1